MAHGEVINSRIAPVNIRFPQVEEPPTTFIQDVIQVVKDMASVPVESFIENVEDAVEVAEEFEVAQEEATPATEPEPDTNKNGGKKNGRR